MHPETVLEFWHLFWNYVEYLWNPFWNSRIIWNTSGLYKLSGILSGILEILEYFWNTGLTSGIHSRIRSGIPNYRSGIPIYRFLEYTCGRVPVIPCPALPCRIYPKYLGNDSEINVKCIRNEYKLY